MVDDFVFSIGSIMTGVSIYSIWKTGSHAAITCVSLHINFLIKVSG
jgi:hypothetical protein